MTQWIFLLIAIAAGACLPMQAGINSGLAKGLEHPLSAAFVSFGTGTLFLLAYLLVLRVPLPNPAKVTAVPWWAWVTGGFLGAYYVSAALFLAPRLGATMLVMTIVTGQILVSVLLDHKGWLGYPEHPINLGRLAGITCMVVGLFLIRRF